jgi:hypothetical protein
MRNRIDLYDQGEIGESLWLARGIGIVRWMSDATPTPLVLVPPWTKGGR